MSTQQKGGKAPFGYTWKMGELVIAEDEAPIVKELFDLYLIHQRKRTVAKLLNEKGYRTRLGKKFQYSTVARILANPTMRGVHRFSTTEKGTSKHIQHESSVPAIVSKELWQQVNDISAAQAGTQTRRPAQDVFVGKILCECDQPMEILSKSDHYSCHRCDARVLIDDVHAIFESSISKIPFPTENELKSTRAGQFENSGRAIDSNIQKIERDIDKLFELHAVDALTPDAFKERHAKLAVRLTQLKNAKEKHGAKPMPSYSTLLDCWQSLNQSKQFTFADTLLHSMTFKANVASVSIYPLFNFAQEGTASHP